MGRRKDPINYTISKEYEIIEKSSSKGYQVKYYKDGYWYKINDSGYQGLTENIVSVILKHSNVSNFVEYEECLINGKKGCRSKNFLKENEEFITFHRLYKAYYGRELSNEIMKIPDIKDRIEYVLNEMYLLTKVNLEDYLKKILTLDMLIVNTDRHFNNLGLIKNENGYMEAPIYDNGAGLLSNYSEFPFEEEIEEAISHASAKPFSGSFHSQVQALGIGLNIDYHGLLKELSEFPDSRAVRVLKYQLKFYEKDIPKLSKSI